jgi:hypothetical protein
LWASPDDLTAGWSRPAAPAPASTPPSSNGCGDACLEASRRLSAIDLGKIQIHQDQIGLFDGCHGDPFKRWSRR